MDVHKVFDEKLSGYCSTVFAETQSDTSIEKAGEEATKIESIAIQLFNEHPQRKQSERYVNAFYIDRGSNEQQIYEIEALEGEISADEVIPNAECGKCFEGEERDEGLLLVVSVPQISFSMKLYSPCKGCSTIVVDEFNEILKTSTSRIANTFIDQCLLNQFQLNIGATTFVVHVQGIASNFCVWDPGISSEFLVLTGSDKRLLKKYWSSFSCGATSNRGKGSFWAHEWETHETYSYPVVPDEYEYFLMTLNVSFKYNIIGVLFEVRYVPSNSEKYPLGGIISAIQNAFHATPELIRLGDADTYYVIIVDRLGGSSLVQIHTIFVNMSNVPRVAASNVSKIKRIIYGSLSDIIGCFTRLHIYEIITHLCHVILCKVINDQKVRNTDEVNSGILQATNQILILFVKVFTGNSQEIYNTPGYRMKFIDMNLEDKILLRGESIIVNQDNSARLYGLDAVNKTDSVDIVGPSKMLESFIWDPGPISYC